MPRMPGAKWTPLASNWSSQRRMSKYDLVILHTMVGSLWGTDGWFRRDGYGGVESHFGVGWNGENLQWQDTTYRAEANGEANHRAISIETADVGTGFPRWNLNDGSAVPAWRDEQLEVIAQIVAWSCKTHNIPCELIPDAKPHRRGIGYHRQGVPGFMVPGAEMWSSARGKVCPGQRRINQIPGIINRARQIMGQGPQPVKPVPIPTPLPPNTKKVKDDMGLQNFVIPAEKGLRRMRLNCPTGTASAIVARSWISFSIVGPDKGSARVWAQNDRAGISDRWFNMSFSDGRSTRDWWQLPDGTTTINIDYDMPNGGCITLETEPK